MQELSGKVGQLCIYIHTQEGFPMDAFRQNAGQHGLEGAL